MTKTSHDSETKKEGQQVITACAFIHQKYDGVEKLFLPKRADTKKFLPGVYELPGGHIDFGEDLVSGLKREIKEEFSKKIEVGDPFFAFTYENKIKMSHSVEIVYFAHFTDDQKIKLNPEDHSEYIWIKENELDKVIASGKSKEDPEVEAIQKGFSLLGMKSLNF